MAFLLYQKQCSHMCDEMSIKEPTHQQWLRNQRFSISAFIGTELARLGEAPTCIVLQCLHVLLTHMLIKTGAEQSIKCSVLYLCWQRQACYCAVARIHRHRSIPNVDSAEVRKWSYIQAMFACPKTIGFHLEIGDIWRPYVLLTLSTWASQLHVFMPKESGT